eukprot:GHVU01067578.1.p1 GENE.GHVU01067578.1~~GHVU01067578.1.p1  ORF type:complete len:143 (-),score=11.85 GHVU01067578.1:23-451(-)
MCHMKCVFDNDPHYPLTESVLVSIRTIRRVVSTAKILVIGRTVSAALSPHIGGVGPHLASTYIYILAVLLALPATKASALKRAIEAQMIREQPTDDFQSTVLQVLIIASCFFGSTHCVHLPVASAPGSYLLTIRTLDVYIFV